MKLFKLVSYFNLTSVPYVEKSELEIFQIYWSTDGKFRNFRVLYVTVKTKILVIKIELVRFFLSWIIAQLKYPIIWCS